MPPKKATNADDAGAGSTHGYTDGEIQLMIALIKRIPRPATFDADQIAVDIGSASGSSVKKRISNAVAKYGWFAGGTATASDGDSATPAATPVKKPRAKRTPKKKAPDSADDDEEGAEETPKKKKARTSKAKTKVEPEAEAEAEEEKKVVKEESGEGAGGEEGEGQI
ncbi:hypothetical protein CkaCkLH20_11506 [Colletotrichum karsti]|uniref:Uncharacterized protein n=1 Tax=Colletotrichum karsti TaxID=1095194 RepID=A0A9P6HVF3_9PEZI|nr:uncharacterized protein CkaCkLH20_11506 [Colletotrichum karsti]KAF9871089.1 hypothetical protein CkaCkLH20_11506 [Colletotrichum karsti]